MIPAHQPSKVVAIFLAQFDVHSGYKLVWSKSILEDFDFKGLDYKGLPSGIHETTQSTILISHVLEKLYYGVSRFRRYIVGEETGESDSATSPDRDNVKMYSLGILCDPMEEKDQSKSWKPNEFINNGWEYIDILDAELALFIQNDTSYEGLANLFAEMVSDSSKKTANSSHSRFSTNSPFTPNINNHLLTKLPNLFEMAGPLLFTLYKQSLLRKRILIFNKNNYQEPDQEPDHDYYFILNSFTYLISLLSIIPQNISTISKDEKKNSYSQPIYNVGLQDLSGSGLLEMKGYVGTTNDEILLYQKDLYDIAVIINGKNKDELTTVLDAKDIGAYVDVTKRIKATSKDYFKFKSIYKDLFASKSGPFPSQRTFTNHSNLSTDDLNSINTSEELHSIKMCDFSEPSFEEPSWWLNYSTESISWRESIWSAFSWFASAGQVENAPQSTTPTPKKRDADLDLDLLQLINIVGYFHKLTKKWIYLINEIVLEQLEDQRGCTNNDIDIGGDDDMNASLISSLTSNSKINIELTYQDLVDMELDPYSYQDLDFVRDFVLLYWGSVVDNVEIGIGFNGVCC